MTSKDIMWIPLKEAFPLAPSGVYRGRAVTNGAYWGCMYWTRTGERIFDPGEGGYATAPAPKELYDSVDAPDTWSVAFRPDGRIYMDYNSCYGYPVIKRGKDVLRWEHYGKNSFYYKAGDERRTPGELVSFTFDDGDVRFRAQISYGYLPSQ